MPAPSRASRAKWLNIGSRFTAPPRAWLARLIRRCAVDTDTSCAAATSSSVIPSIVRATKNDRSLPPSLSIIR
jgi:hypothetical protein